MYAGNKYSCPFCRKTHRQFIPFFNIYSVSKTADIISHQDIDHSFCPYCYSAPRDRAVYFFLEKQGGLAGKKVLHFAPEKSLYSYISSLNCAEYVCGDISPENYRFAKQIRKMNLLALDYPDNYFDLIICSHVLEHIETDRVAMKELFRVLNKSGCAVLLVPISAKLQTTYEDPSKTTEYERSETFGQYDHVRIYTEKDYMERLSSVGFSVKAMMPPVTGEEMVKYCLNPREKLYIVSK
jgi:SAM-dependent methyltransferase